MLDKIIGFSLGNRFLVLVAAVLLTLAGVYTAENMEVDVFPDLNAPTVTVMTEAGGMAPEEVEHLVTFPIETALNGATDVMSVRSSSSTGFSVVTVQFDWGTDIYRARQIVSERLDVARDKLPDGVGNPVMGPQSSILGEVMLVELTSDSTSMRDLRTLADWRIRPALLALGGVAKVDVLGGDVKEFQILLNPGRMRHFGVSLDDVMASVEDMNRDVSGGILYDYGNEYIIRGMCSTTDVGRIAASLVKLREGHPVLLGAVARVIVGDRAPRIGVASYRGRPSVVMTVTKQPDTGTMDLTERIDAALVKVGASLPSDVRLHTDVYRQSSFIESSIDNVRDALIQGGVFVVVVLFLFLMNVRTTVISLITIPLSLLAAVVSLHVMGFTINTMSLGGMCIAIGSLVDDAIVDVENVFKRLRENRSLAPELRRSVVSVIYDASREVRLPILNSTLIIVASFVPLFFLSGMEGLMLAPLGVAFIVALCSSTLVALTVTPVLCSYLLRGSAADGAERGAGVRLQRVYRGLLRRALGHRRVVLASTAGALLVSVVMYVGFGSGFLPPFNEGSFTINLTTLPGISLEESDRLGRLADEALLSVPEIQSVGRKTGRAELSEHSFGVNTSEIEAPYVLGNRSKRELIHDIRERLGEIPGVSVVVGAPISHRIDAMLSGTRASIAVKLYGTDLNTMFNIAKRIREVASQVPGVADLNVEQQVERPQMKIVPRREMLALYGISMPQFSRAVSVLLAGVPVSQVYQGDQTFDLVLKVDDDFRASFSDVGRLMLDTGDGRKVALSDVADVVSSAGPNTINRENVARKVVVSANAEGRDVMGVVEDIQNAVAQNVVLPQGYRVEYGGQFESQKSASRILMLASVLSVLVIFMLLYNQFRSVRQSVVILLNLPLALIGGVVAIWLTGGMVSIPSIIGFISLFGIATRNGMLLISRYNDLRDEGAGAVESVLRGSADRLNPILMTALTSALALIPMVVGSDLPGNEIQSPMAVVILGGLFTSTLLNGFVIPVMYLLTEGERNYKI